MMKSNKIPMSFGGIKIAHGGYCVKSFWAGKYAHGYHGWSTSLLVSIKWFVVWSWKDFKRVLTLNKYHWGNILCIGKKLTDDYGRKSN